MSTFLHRGVESTSAVLIRVGSAIAAASLVGGSLVVGVATIWSIVCKDPRPLYVCAIGVGGPFTLGVLALSIGHLLDPSPSAEDEEHHVAFPETSAEPLRRHRP